MSAKNTLRIPYLRFLTLNILNISIYNYNMHLYIYILRLHIAKPLVKLLLQTRQE